MVERRKIYCVGDSRIPSKVTIYLEMLNFRSIIEVEIFICLYVIQVTADGMQFQEKNGAFLSYFISLEIGIPGNFHPLVGNPASLSGWDLEVPEENLLVKLKQILEYVCDFYKEPTSWDTDFAKIFPEIKV